MFPISRHHFSRWNPASWPTAGAARRERSAFELATVAFAVLLSSSVYAQVAPAQASSSGATLDKDKVSYAIGYQIGSQFTGNQPSIDLAALQRGLGDAYSKRHPSVPMPQMRAQLRALEQQMHASAVNEFTHVAEGNARRSALFMADNGKLAGVIQLPSGIQYQVLKRGNGKLTPLVTSRVTINYRGMLPDGTEFDSTWAHGAPVTFNVSGVISGWRDVIPRMHVGDRWKVVIPPRLAYGKQGALPRIGPNEALVFDIELLDIVQR